MNRKLIVSILAIILVVAMVLSLVLAALPPATFGGNTAVTGVFDTFSAICATTFGIAA